MQIGKECVILEPGTGYHEGILRESFCNAFPVCAFAKASRSDVEYFIGGASSRGGSGTVHGALIGALVMASLDNGMSMLGIEAFWQMIVKGSILLLAVWIDVVSGTSDNR
jgi:hypothetical protein